MNIFVFFSFLRHFPIFSLMLPIFSFLDPWRYFRRHDVGNTSLDNSVEWALVDLDLNEPVLESITFDDGDPLEGLSSISTDADIALDIE
jgi:hypothetical protein